MPHPLFLLPFTLLLLLLLLSTPPTTSTPLNPLTHPSFLHPNLSTDDPNCWHSPSPPLIFASCASLIRNTLGFPHDPDTPMSFSRRRGTTILIPYAKTSPGCSIVLGIKNDRLTTVWETWREIKREAMEVAIKCVMRPPHFGGWGWVGGGELLVSVIGYERGRGLQALEARGEGQGGEDGVEME
ncbi:MAG: hypothetical protein Q9166_000488 [cf. Caloplaca sp. 2 TL-2023]